MTDFEFSELPEDCAPEIARLFDYWRSIHPDAGLPGRRHFDPVDIPRLLPNIWLLDVYRQPLRFRVRLSGMAINEFTGLDRTGEWCDELCGDREDTDALLCKSACVLHGKPLYRTRKVISNPGQTNAMAEILHLPLASNGRDVDMLLNMTQYLNRKFTRS
ncbi:MAG: PAS domain-containing protein [Proteobacteria bacterium]|nr:PAS domain-containing protein [Pseudomonadota bacterium]